MFLPFLSAGDPLLSVLSIVLVRSLSLWLLVLQAGSSFLPHSIYPVVEPYLLYFPRCADSYTIAGEHTNVQVLRMSGRGEG